MAAEFISAATDVSNRRQTPRLEDKPSEVRTVYRKESRPAAQRPADEREPYGLLKGSVHHRLGLDDAVTSQGGARWEDQWSRSSRRSRSGTCEAEANRCRR